MANQPVTIPAFNGLDLKTEITELGFNGAADIQNLGFKAPGDPERRPGTDVFSARFADAAEQSPYGGIHYHPPLNAFFTLYRDSGDDGRLIRMDENGFIEAPSDAWHSPAASSLAGARFVSFGSDTAHWVFIATGGCGTDADVVTYDGVAESFEISVSPYTGNAPNGHYLAVTPWDNRLVSAGGDGGGSNTTVHRVRFSTEGDPLTWGTSAGTADDFYVDLHPGDGEEIREVVTWGDLMFVFKQTKFFVFYGVEANSAGDPVFNYRAVHGQGIPLEWDGQAPAAVAAHDGVYFVNLEGVWRTTGGPPQKISTAVDPLFRVNAPEDPNPYYGAVPGDSGTDPYSSITYRRDKLYIYGHEDHVLVYHTREGWWSRWRLPGICNQSFLYSVPEPITSESTLNGFQPDLLYSATVAGTTDYWRGQILMVSEEADQDYGGNYTWSLVATSGTAGNFTLDFHPVDSGTTETTANIAYNATAAQVESALTALDSVDSSDVFCAGGPLPNIPVVIIFTTGGSYSGAAYGAGNLEIGTENVTNGNATLSGVKDGEDPTAISCHWTSGATDLGSDVVKIIKDVLVAADEGSLAVGIATDLGTVPASLDEAIYLSPATVRIRGEATNRKARQIVLHLENGAGGLDEESSRVTWRRATLNVLGAQGGPQRNALVDTS